MGLVYQNGITVDTGSGAIVGVGNLTGNGAGNTQNTLPSPGGGGGTVLAETLGWTPTAASGTVINGQSISATDTNLAAYQAQVAYQAGQTVDYSKVPLGGFVPGGDRGAWGEDRGGSLRSHRPERERARTTS